jgi:hypothetical protein
VGEIITITQWWKAIEYTLGTLINKISSTLGDLHWVNYFLLTTSFAPFFVAPFLVLRGGASLLRFNPDAKLPIAAAVLRSFVIWEDACVICCVHNPIDSKGIGVAATAARSVAAATFVSNNVGEAAGMGGLGQLGFGWALSMRLAVSGLGRGLTISSERASCSMQLNVILVCGEQNSDVAESTLLAPPAGRREEVKGNTCAGGDLSLENGLL